MAEIQFFSVDQIVTRQDAIIEIIIIRNLGYAMRGIRPVCKRLLHRGQRISAVAAMCSEGVIALELGEGTYNGDRFSQASLYQRCFNLMAAVRANLNYNFKITHLL